jgi:hypothetical protein
VGFAIKNVALLFLSFACPKERNKEKGRQIQMLRWICLAHAQVAELAAS